MTPTFAAVDRNRQLGLTLLELLVALALAALLASAAAGGLRASFPQLHVRLASEQLVADLKRARVEADILGAPVPVVFNEAGYGVEALDLERALPPGVRIAIDDAIVEAEESRELFLHPGFAANGHRIVLWKSDRRAEIAVDPITGRVMLR